MSGTALRGLRLQIAASEKQTLLGESMRNAIVLLAIVGLCLSSTPSLAAADTPSNTSSDFFKDWAVGLAILKPSKKGVSDATIANGIVRVNTEARTEASLLVARHFYPWRPGHTCVTANPTVADFWSTCVGAMVGVGLGSTGSAGSNQIINFAGVGLTIGGGIGADTSTAWHFGLGLGRRFNVKVLGDGFSENAAPPTGETQVRYKTIDVNAPFAYFTVHW